MARRRSPERDKAFELWKESGGQLPLRHIAETLSIPEKTVSGWKCKDCWEEKFNGVLQKKKRSTPNEKKKRTMQMVQEFDEEAELSELTERQRLFCIYYVKCFNATQAAIKAGYSKDSAHVTGPRLLGNARIREHIKRLKAVMTQDLIIDAMDILHVYLKILYSDPTDFVEYGQREAPVMGPFGPIIDKKTKKPIMKTVNFVDFKPSSEIDGMLIQEVKQGKEGIGIKLLDKMKALEKLERYFDLLPDHHKRRIEEERLKLDHEKLSIEKAKHGDPEDTEDDGFMAALEGKLNDAWDGYEDGDDDGEA